MEALTKMEIMEILGNVLKSHNHSPDKAIDILEYLSFFNYVDKDNVTIEKILIAIKDFKSQFGIRETTIGPKTVRAMTWPRCGVRERLEVAGAGQAKWGLKDISYFIRRRDPDLSAEVWDSCFARAFQNCSDVTPLKFFKVEKEQEANFVIDVGSGKADDFDGPSGVLAWFQLCPQVNYRGQILGKFDIGETWVADSSKRGIVLPNVATHEILHGLGLTHSNVSTALMAPFYSPNVEKPQQNDDIPRLQALYGKPVVTPPAPIPPQPPNPVPPAGGAAVITVNGNITGISIPGYRVTKIG